MSGEFPLSILLIVYYYNSFVHFFTQIHCQIIPYPSIRETMSSSSQSPEPPTKKRRRSTPSVQTAKKRELDRIAQKKSRDRARNRVLELEDKIVRLQSDDKQKQIADLMRTVEDLRKENDRLRGMTEKIKCLTESAGTRESNHG